MGKVYVLYYFLFSSLALIPRSLRLSHLHKFACYYISLLSLSFLLFPPSLFHVEVPCYCYTFPRPLYFPFLIYLPSFLLPPPLLPWPSPSARLPDPCPVLPHRHVNRQAKQTDKPNTHKQTHRQANRHEHYAVPP